MPTLKRNERHYWQWINPDKRRWYAVLVVRDLFDDLVLIRKWGGLDNQRGGEKKEILPPGSDPSDIIGRINRRRKHRGYHLYESASCNAAGTPDRPDT